MINDSRLFFQQITEANLNGKMQPEFLPFPSIEQFRNVIKELPYVFGRNIPTTLQYVGSVKLHGTNAAIVRHFDDVGVHIDVIQSRNRILSLENDNQECNAFLLSKSYHLLFNEIIKSLGRPVNKHIAIYGEYCGEGIQSKVALCKLKRMFVIFAIKIDHSWVDMQNFAHISLESENIYNIMKFPLYHVEIDTSNPDSILDTLDQMADKIDKECPFAKQLAGVSGAGEGIVWICRDNPSSRLWFKTKGKTHCSSKKGIKSTTDRVNETKEFIELAVSEQRLHQGIQYLEEMKVPLQIQSITDFVTWNIEDILREERDTIVDNNLNIAEVKKAISKHAGSWYKTYLATNQHSVD